MSLINRRGKTFARFCSPYFMVKTLEKCAASLWSVFFSMPMGLAHNLIYMQTAGLNIFWIIFGVIKFYVYYSLSSLVFSTRKKPPARLRGVGFSVKMSARNTMNAWCHQNSKMVFDSGKNWWVFVLLLHMIDTELLRNRKLNYGFYESNSDEFVSDGNVCGFIIFHSFRSRKQQQKQERKSAISDGSVKEEKIWHVVVLLRSEICMFLRVFVVMVISSWVRDSWGGAEWNRDTENYNSRSIW